MGYIPGKGIGKDGTGIAEPISESSNKGRHGLGYILRGLETEDVKWELEEVNYEQIPEWMNSCQKQPLTIEDFTGWIYTGKKKLSIEDETSFCSPEILERILSSKTIFDNLTEKEFIDARTRSNPFESIKGVIFQNRAAMKMANIDAVFNYMFTKPKKKIEPNDVLYFADICAGPGGFSEYILWRLKWHAKAFGLTLKDPSSGSDFKLENFLSAPCETFDAHYGFGGFDGDGDITRPENITAFKSYVLDYTDGRGVHFVMADGGISVEGQENIQEILTKQLVLCQYLCALSILCKGGNFVCKVFDMFTPFSVGLFYLLYRCFSRVCLFKPVTSRPANSERYVVCENLIQQNPSVEEYMFAINLKLIELKNSDQDVLSVVPNSVILNEKLFYDYVTAFNDSFGVNQITHLKKLQYFVKNQTLQDHRQTDIRHRCLNLWKIPNLPRTSSLDVTANEMFHSIWDNIPSLKSYEVLHSKTFRDVNIESLNSIKDLYSWRWCWAVGKRYLLVGIGRNKVYTWDLSGVKPSFTQRSEIHGLELPKGTILEVEITSELQGEGSGQRKETIVKILDIISINQELFYPMKYKERVYAGTKLCKAINKPSRKGTVVLKMKNFYHFSEFERTFSKLQLKDCKGHQLPIPTFPIDESKFFSPVGVMFFKITKDPWHIYKSKNEQKFYYFNDKTGESKYECPPQSLASFSESLLSRHLWIWKRNMFRQLCSADSNTEFKKSEENEVSKLDIFEHFRANL